MFPAELPGRVLKLPDTGNHTIVIVTGGGLRHKRFALRLQAEFGKDVVAWFELAKENGAGGSGGGFKRKILERLCKSLGAQGGAGAKTLAGRAYAKIRSFLRRRGLLQLLRAGLRWTAEQAMLLRNKRRAKAAEHRLFDSEIGRLLRTAHLQPERVTPEQIHSHEFAERVRALKPYFLLTLGGPLYRKHLLETVEGVAINQHAGHSPKFRGSNTTEWALYHRDLDSIGSTVHITTTGADAGPILRRSTICLHAEDDIPTLFFRTVALGTELLIECVQTIRKRGEITIFEQPASSGRTYLARQMNAGIIASIMRDLSRDWLRRELVRQKEF